MFKKILIANRGEIALRVQRTCREMGIATVAVHSTADADAMHVRLADERVCIGPPQAGLSYLNIPAIVSAATVVGADAIHPGYGFLSENAEFAAILEEHGIAFIGPTADHIALMGDKVAARRAAADAGIPVLPGSDGPVGSVAEAFRVAGRVGYPVLVKAAGGGGGRGIKIVRAQESLEESYAIARAEAKAGFGDDRVYIEKCLERPRHIEVQVFGDGRGGAIHLGERDCSLQRRHQKVLEEAGSPALDRARADEIGETAAAAMRRIRYRNAGTVEFLYEDGAFHFIEMNTRLQVEHPVTEMLTGLDLVREQILVAAGGGLSVAQSGVRRDGHAIECRINAEDPATFAPAPGRVSDYHPPGGLGVRVDSGLYAGCSVPPFYDSLVSKLVVHGADRAQCIARLDRALEEYVIGGVESTLPLHRRIVADPGFAAGEYDIHWLERTLAADAAGAAGAAEGA